MTIEINSGLEWQVREKGCVPVLFNPDVDCYGLEDPSIIEAF